MYSSRVLSLGIDPVRTQVEPNIAHYYGSDKQYQPTVFGFCAELITNLMIPCERPAHEIENVFDRFGRQSGASGRAGRDTRVRALCCSAAGVPYPSAKRRLIAEWSKQ
jgi:hypothetical protein